MFDLPLEGAARWLGEAGYRGARLTRPDVADGRESAMAEKARLALRRTQPPYPNPSHSRCEASAFLKNTGRRPPMPPLAQGERGRKPRSYLTNFSTAVGRRRWPCGEIGARGFFGLSSGVIASHKALNSESAIRLSVIRSCRMATDTNCAVSRLVLSASTARHCSRVARTECSRCSELATGVFFLTELAR
jgi:hypothetical protein